MEGGGREVENKGLGGKRKEAQGKRWLGMRRKKKVKRGECGVEKTRG